MLWKRHTEVPGAADRGSGEAVLRVCVCVFGRMKQTSNLRAEIREFLKASNFHSESYFWSKSELSTFLRGRREHKGLQRERRRVRGKSETRKVRRIPKIRPVILKLQYFGHLMLRKIEGRRRRG